MIRTTSPTLTADTLHLAGFVQVRPNEWLYSRMLKPSVYFNVIVMSEDMHSARIDIINEYDGTEYNYEKLKKSTPKMKEIAKLIDEQLTRLAKLSVLEVI